LSPADINSFALHALWTHEATEAVHESSTYFLSHEISDVTQVPSNHSNLSGQHSVQSDDQNSWCDAGCDAVQSEKSWSEVGSELGDGDAAHPPSPIQNPPAGGLAASGECIEERMVVPHL